MNKTHFHILGVLINKLYYFFDGRERTDFKIT